MIDKSLTKSGAGKLQVSADMQTEAADTVTDNAEYDQTKANLAG
jgi:hypothetical protein